MREIRRKFIHIVLGSAFILFYYWAESITVFAVTILGIILGFVLSHIIQSGKKLPVIEELLEKTEREDEKKFPGKGPILFFVGFFALLLLDLTWIQNKAIALGALSILVYGDGFAALVGNAVGHHKWFGKKSLEGTLAFVLISFIYLGILYGNYGTALLVALVAGAMELMVPVNDNLSLPIVSGVALKLLL